MLVLNSAETRCLGVGDVLLENRKAACWSCRKKNFALLVLVHHLF